MRRRQFMLGAGSTLFFSVPLAILAAPAEFARTEDEWRAILTPQEYAVLRLGETEQPYSSPLTDEKRRGLYACGGCGLAAFSSQAKYNSRTGWPSFFRPLGRSVRETRDRSQDLSRTKVECLRCGCHLGHVFGDGPPPTRLRYCLNGVGLNFVPA